MMRLRPLSLIKDVPVALKGGRGVIALFPSFFNTSQQGIILGNPSGGRIFFKASSDVEDEMCMSLWDGADVKVLMQVARAPFEGGRCTMMYDGGKSFVQCCVEKKSPTKRAIAAVATFEQ